MRIDAHQNLEDIPHRDFEWMEHEGMIDEDDYGYCVHCQEIDEVYEEVVDGVDLRVCATCEKPLDESQQKEKG